MGRRSARNFVQISDLGGVVHQEGQAVAAIISYKELKQFEAWEMNNLLIGLLKLVSNSKRSAALKAMRILLGD
ncbi:MAG: hypothetical protein WBB28_18350 [Crinalium sp.]